MGTAMKEYNLERSPEFQRLTTDKAWTEADVRRILPDVPCLDGATARTGRIVGRCNAWATVHLEGMANGSGFMFSWTTIANALNNNRALRI